MSMIFLLHLDILHMELMMILKIEMPITGDRTNCSI